MDARGVEVADGMLVPVIGRRCTGGRVSSRLDGWRVPGFRIGM
jgi:hypothetical protein